MAVVEEGRFGKAPLRFDVSPRTSALGGRKPVEQRCSVAPRPLSALAQSFRSSSLLGDGQWVWRVDLAHHVAKYRLGLGQELLSYLVGEVSSLPDSSQAVSEVMQLWQRGLKICVFDFFSSWLRCRYERGCRPVEDSTILILN